MSFDTTWHTFGRGLEADHEFIEQDPYSKQTNKIVIGM